MRQGKWQGACHFCCIWWSGERSPLSPGLSRSQLGEKERERTVTRPFPRSKRKIWAPQRAPILSAGDDCRRVRHDDDLNVPRQIIRGTIGYNSLRLQLLTIGGGSYRPGPSESSWTSSPFGAVEEGIVPAPSPSCREVAARQGAVPGALF